MSDEGGQASEKEAIVQERELAAAEDLGEAAPAGEDEETELEGETEDETEERESEKISEKKAESTGPRRAGREARTMKKSNRPKKSKPKRSSAGRGRRSKRASR